MTPERDEESGEYIKEYETESFFEAIESLDTATTQKISNEVGCSYDLAYRKLKSLEREEAVKSEKVGNTLIWSVK